MDELTANGSCRDQPDPSDDERSDRGRERPAAAPEGCFLCGRVFRPGYPEPIDEGGIQLCVGCGAAWELPSCC